MAVHVLGGGVGHDVGTPLEGAAVDRGGEGVVHDERHAVGVGCLRKLFNVQHGQGGVGDGLAEYDLGVGAERGVQLFLGAQRVHEGGLDAHLFHGDRDEVEGAAVDGAGCHDVVTGLAKVEQGEEVGSLPAGSQHGSGAAFQFTDLLGHKVTGGVLQAGVEVGVRRFRAYSRPARRWYHDSYYILLCWVCPYSTIPRREHTASGGELKR